MKKQLDKVSSAYSEAKAQLKERAANQRIVNAAKTTAAELAVSREVETRVGGVQTAAEVGVGARRNFQRTARGFRG